ncbi:hypothetical protein N7E01_09045 [Neopusillimonas aromaticivorans]|nr:hypothetical protein [Neopusillimonas aromaticivorans]WJJ92524.1 hypothetical protein N7E01_09045 [Neopusillimonas aromaticivorans]
MMAAHEIEKALGGDDHDIHVIQACRQPCHGAADQKYGGLDLVDVDPAGAGGVFVVAHGGQCQTIG